MAIGKIFGILFGIMLGGSLGMPFLGMLLGLYLGAKIDRQIQGEHYRQQSFFHTFGDHLGGFGARGGHSPSQQIFFDVTFAVMGHIAKSDGRISSDEIRAAEAVMAQMRMTTAMREAAVAAFKRGKQASFDLNETLAQFRHVCGHQPFLCQLFIDIQWQAAQASGSISARKQALLNQVAEILGSGFGSGGFHGGFGSGQYQQQGGFGGHTRTGQGSLDEAYRTLGINRQASDSDVKKAYRRLMRENHPDKLTAKGLPEEMIKLANQKVSKIQTAYEAIKNSRGFK